MNTEAKNVAMIKIERRTNTAPSSELNSRNFILYPILNNTTSNLDKLPHESNKENSSKTGDLPGDEVRNFFVYSHCNNSKKHQFLL